MKNRSSRACNEAGDTKTLGTSDEVKAARAEFHLKHCSECQEDEQIMERARDAVLSADSTLDDMTRARVQSRLAEAMEDAVAGKKTAAPVWRGRTGKILAMAAAAVAVLVAAALIWPSGPEPQLKSGVQPAPLAQVDLKANRVLQPHSILEGSSPWPNSGLNLGQKVARLNIPAGVALRANLTGKATLTLYGPLDLAVVKASEAVVELQLTRGILVGEYDGEQGGTLRIKSPRATTEIIGTLFYIEATDGQSRVAVSRGKVKVSSAGDTVMVGARQIWSTVEVKEREMPASVSALLAKHDRPGEVASAVIPRPEAAAPASVKAVQGRVQPRAPKENRMRSLAQAGKAAGVTTSAASVPKALGGEQAPAMVDKAAAAPEKKPIKAKTASSLYAGAEAALRARNVEQAQQILYKLLKEHPDDPLVDSARYELALLLHKNGKLSQAEAVLNKIGTGRGGSRFQEPSHFLKCRIRQESGQVKEALGCYRAFRKQYRTSPHDARALQAIMALTGQR